MPCEAKIREKYLCSRHYNTDLKKKKISLFDIALVMKIPKVSIQNEKEISLTIQSKIEIGHKVPPPPPPNTIGEYFYDLSV